MLVDGKIISSENYTLSGEPLALTLNAFFLDSLSAGEHTIEIVTVNGSAMAKFTVKEKHQENEGGNANKQTDINNGEADNTNGRSHTSANSVATGDESSMRLWALLTCPAIAGLVFAVHRITKRKTHKK